MGYSISGVGREALVRGISLLETARVSKSLTIDPEWIPYLPQERLSEVVVALALCVIARAGAEAAFELTKRGLQRAADYTGVASRFQLPDSLGPKALIAYHMLFLPLFTSYCSEHAISQVSVKIYQGLLPQLYALGYLPTLSLGFLWILQVKTAVAFSNIFHQKSPVWITLPRDWGTAPTRHIFCVLLDTGLSLATSFALARLPRAKTLACLKLIPFIHESLKVFGPSALIPRCSLSAEWNSSLISAVRMISSVAIACLVMRIPLSPSQWPVLLAFAVLTPPLIGLCSSLQSLIDLLLPEFQSFDPPSGTSASTNPQCDTDYALMGISRATSYENARRSYRQKALTLHPDKGGSAESFKALQEAWTRIQKERGWLPPV